MRYKENWEDTKKRLTAFWQGELIDRCVVSVQAGDGRYCPPQIPGDDAGIEGYWTDPEQIVYRTRQAMEHTYYGGDSIPMASLNMGASGHAAFFKGEKLHFFSHIK